MNLVIDTNILLVSVSTGSKYRWIFDAFLDEKFNLCVTTDILLEYEEILSRHMGNKFASVIMQIIENAPNAVPINRYYSWNLIEADFDDNKFVDCAIACGAQYLVTNDKHFSVLKKIEFPKVNVIGIQELEEILALL